MINTNPKLLLLLSLVIKSQEDFRVSMPLEYTSACILSKWLGLKDSTNQQEEFAIMPYIPVATYCKPIGVIADSIRCNWQYVSFHYHHLITDSLRKNNICQ
jgi:hypothetical protein